MLTSTHPSDPSAQPSGRPEEGIDEDLRQPERGGFNEQAAVDSLRNKCMLCSWALGLAAGVIKGANTPGDSPLFIDAVVGMSLAFLGGVLGGFLGALANLVLQLLRGRRDQGSGDLAEGVILGSFVGGFLGLVAALLFASPQDVVTGTAIGSSVGAFVGAFQPDTAKVLLRMLAHDARPEPKADDPPQPEA